MAAEVFAGCDGAALGLPWGVVVGLPTLPLPTKSIVDPPIELGLPPEAADDPELVKGL